MIPNGVQPVSSVEPELISKEYGLLKDNYILYLGRLVPEKGLTYLIEAFKSVNTNKKLVMDIKQPLTLTQTTEKFQEG